MIAVSRNADTTAVEPPRMVDYLLATVAHLVFAALWVGSVCYVAFVVLPLAWDGAFKTTAPLGGLSGKLTTISRVSALALLLSGGHMAGAGYTAESLRSTLEGRLVLLMVGLWLVMAALVEVGAKRFEAGLDDRKLREPARDALPLFRGAAAAGIALLVVAGLLSADVARLV